MYGSLVASTPPLGAAVGVWSRSSFARQSDAAGETQCREHLGGVGVRVRVRAVLRVRIMVRVRVG